MIFQNKKLHTWLLVLIAFISIISCREDTKEEGLEEDIALIEAEVEKYEFGFKLNDYVVIRDTIKQGDSFGVIMERNRIGYPQIYNIVEKAKDTFNIARLQVGKPYSL